MSPKISVIIPIFRVERYLMQCIDSVRKQSLQEIEIILVDEGDDDLCFAMMQFHAKQDSRIHIIHEKHGGYGASCNAGFQLAMGEYIAIVESDDFIEPTMYEEMYAFAKKHDLDTLKTPYYRYWDSISNTPSKRLDCTYKRKVADSAPQGAFNIVDAPQQMGFHASVWAALYKRSFFSAKAVTFVAAKGASYVDVLFRIRSLVEASRVGWLDKAFYNYRITNADSSTNNYNISTMLVRWKEAHDYFEAQDLNVYESVGPYLIYDEFVNTYEFLEKLPITPADYESARQNLLRIPARIWQKSPLMSADNQKLLQIIAANESFDEFKAKAAILRATLHDKRKRKLRIHSIVKCFYFEVVLRYNLFRIHLNPLSARTFVSLRFTLLKRISFQFVIGK